MFAEHHIKRNTVFEVSDVQTAMQFVEKDLGVAVVPSELARSLTASHRILSLKISNQDPYYQPKWRIAILRRSPQKGPDWQKHG
jgi:DNA-binding transcriptional LysR family regulator